MKRQVGFTLVEFGLVLVVAIGILWTLLAASSGGTGQSNRSLVVQQTLRLHASILESYANQSSYAGISNTVLLDRGAVPQDLIALGTDGVRLIRTASGMPIDVGAHEYVGGGNVEALGASYYAYVRGLNSESCRAVAMAIAPQALYLAVIHGETGAGTLLATDRNAVIDTNAVATGCSSRAYSDVFYIAN